MTREKPRTSFFKDESGRDESAAQVYTASVAQPVRIGHDARFDGIADYFPGMDNSGKDILGPSMEVDVDDWVRMHEGGGALAKQAGRGSCGCAGSEKPDATGVMTRTSPRETSQIVNQGGAGSFRPPRPKVDEAIERYYRGLSAQEVENLRGGPFQEGHVSAGAAGKASQLIADRNTALLWYLCEYLQGGSDGRSHGLDYPPVGFAFSVFLTGNGSATYLGGSNQMACGGYSMLGPKASEWTAMTEDTVLNIASTSKSFTAFCLVYVLANNALVREEFDKWTANRSDSTAEANWHAALEWVLTRPLVPSGGEFLGSFPFLPQHLYDTTYLSDDDSKQALSAAESIRILDLIQHISGLPKEPANVGKEFPDPDDPRNLALGLSEWQQNGGGITTKPQGTYFYSDLNYTLLRYVIVFLDAQNREVPISGSPTIIDAYVGAQYQSLMQEMFDLAIPGSLVSDGGGPSFYVRPTPQLKVNSGYAYTYIPAKGGSAGDVDWGTYFDPGVCQEHASWRGGSDSWFASSRMIGQVVAGFASGIVLPIDYWNYFSTTFTGSNFKTEQTNWLGAQGPEASDGSMLLEKSGDDSALCYKCAPDALPPPCVPDAHGYESGVSLWTHSTWVLTSFGVLVSIVTNSNLLYLVEGERSPAHDKLKDIAADALVASGWI